MTITGAFACWTAHSLKNGPAEAQRSGTAPLIVFYLFVGLSFLAKGLIGPVIIFGVIGLYYLIRRDLPPGKFARSLLWGLPLAAGVAALWFGPMLARHGWSFVDQFVLQHHFARFTSDKYHHPGPIYFYLPVLLGLALPWTVFLFSSLVSSRRWTWRGTTPLDRLRVLALTWLFVPVVFFSFSGSKLIAYILPVLPAVALLVGERLISHVREHRSRTVFRLTGALLLILAIAAGVYAVRVHNLRPVLLLTILPLFAVGLFTLIKPHFTRAVVVSIGVAIFLTAISANYLATPIGRRESVRDLLVTATSRGYGNAPVVQLHNIERTAEFYAAKRIEYGSDGEPLKFEGAMQVLDAARRSGGAVLCFVPVEFQSQVTLYSAVETEAIGNNGRVVLLAVWAR
jgi:4-amino-4-deoxy-L-arabinose transferase-like glycosyltransferase